MVLLITAHQAHAQTATVGELIDKAKAARAAELMGLPAKQTPSGPKATKTPLAPTKPKVWSIVGMNDNFEAVMVDHQKVYLVRSQQLPATVGAWQITNIKAQEVWVKETQKPKSITEVVLLPGPDKDASLDEYAKTLNIQLIMDDKGNVQSVSSAPQQVSQLATQPAPLPPSAQPLPSGPAPGPYKSPTK